MSDGEYAIEAVLRLRRALLAANSEPIAIVFPNDLELSLVEWLFDNFTEFVWPMNRLMGVDLYFMDIPEPVMHGRNPRCSVRLSSLALE